VTDKIIFLVILLSVSTAAGLMIGKIMDFTHDDEDVDDMSIYLKRNE